ncbi:hypothetical protein RYA60_10300, partial [Pseudomonas syringae]|nr:hypothetical protein [Pseudomonas syringae]
SCLYDSYVMKVTNNGNYNTCVTLLILGSISIFQESAQNFYAFGAFWFAAFLCHTMRMLHFPARHR